MKNTPCLRNQKTEEEIVKMLYESPEEVTTDLLDKLFEYYGVHREIVYQESFHRIVECSVFDKNGKEFSFLIKEKMSDFINNEYEIEKVIGKAKDRDVWEKYQNMIDHAADNEGVIGNRCLEFVKDSYALETIPLDDKNQYLVRVGRYFYHISDDNECFKMEGPAGDFKKYLLQHTDAMKKTELLVSEDLTEPIIEISNDDTEILYEQMTIDDLELE